MRVELTWVTPHAPQTCAYTNSAIPAACSIIVRGREFRNYKVSRIHFSLLFARKGGPFLAPQLTDEKIGDAEIDQERTDVHDGCEQRLRDDGGVFLDRGGAHGQ